MIEDFFYKFASIYQSSPNALKFFLGKFYSRIPNQLKLGKKYIFYKNLINKTEWWTEEEIIKFQFEKIKSTILYAYTNVPFYQNFWNKCGFNPKQFRNIEDMNKIPFINKEDIRNNIQKFLSKKIHKYKILEVTTGGSTGEPLSIYYYKGLQRPREKAFMEKQWSRIGYHPNDLIAVLRSTVVESYGKRTLWTYDPTMNRHVFSTFDLSNRNLPIILNKLRKIKPKFLHVYPSVLTIIAHFIKTNNVPTIKGLKGILAGSENTFPWQTELFEEVFNCKVLRWYGHSEMAILAGSCDHSYYYHCFPEYSFVELINRNGINVTEEGKVGEIVGTAFDNPAMPLIRYRTGDYAAKGPKECTCGRKHFLLGEIQGRSQEKIVSFDGSQFSLGPIIFGIHNVFWKNVVQIQFVQIQKGELIIKVEPSYPEVDNNKINQLISKNIIFKLKGNFNTKVELTNKFEKTPNGKHKILVSYV